MKIALLARVNLFSTPGGDTVQIEATHFYLNKMGIKTEIITQPYRVILEQFDIIHFFNLGRPEEIFRFWDEIKNKPLIISSIYVDYSTTNLLNSKTALVQRCFGKHAVEYIKTIVRYTKGQLSFPSWRYILLGQKRSIAKLLSNSSLVIASSKAELLRIHRDFNVPINSTVVPLGVNPTYEFPKLKRERKGILCVGRIEPLKNQLRLIQVCEENNWPLTIVGTPAPNHKVYFEDCKKAAKGKIQFLGQQSPETLCELYQSHLVHAMPSYFETFNLSTLEAIVCGCYAVLGSQTDAKEIYGNAIAYANPDDKTSIENTLREALTKTIPKEKALEFKEKYSWQSAAQKIALHYTTLFDK